GTVSGERRIVIREWDDVSRRWRDHRGLHHSGVILECGGRTPDRIALVRERDPIRLIIRALRAPLDLDADVFRYRVYADGTIVAINEPPRWSESRCSRSSCA